VECDRYWNVVVLVEVYDRNSAREYELTCVCDKGRGEAVSYRVR
jgi:hypothetical protein